MRILTNAICATAAATMQQISICRRGRIHSPPSQLGKTFSDKYTLDIGLNGRFLSSVSSREYKDYYDRHRVLLMWFIQAIASGNYRRCIPSTDV